MNPRGALVLVLLSLPALIPAPAAGGQEAPAAPVRPEPGEAAADRLAWWREARFGLFVHWGPVALAGTEIGWSRGGERRGRDGRGEVPAAVYDDLYRKFDPAKFDAAAWAALAKAAGMRYFVFTTRHHDGFSMFDSRLTEYKITKTPFGRDVTAELAEAFRNAGIRVGFYHSQPDWYHPDYRTENHPRFLAFLHGQVEELCTRYGPLDIVWFDGLGGKAEDWDAPALFALIRRLQPRALINNRCGLPGDFDTPEQRVGVYKDDRPWESCITLCRQWAWKPDDRMKSLEECLRLLLQCVGGDGNLLLNVGPMPTGEIEPRQAARLREIGAWLGRHGEGVYGTRGGPWKPWAGGASTRRGNSVYLFIWEGRGEPLRLPALPRRVAAAGAGGRPVRVDAEGVAIVLHPPAPAAGEPIQVVRLELDGPAAGIPPMAVGSSGSLAFDRPARASNVFKGRAEYGPAMAVDDNPATRWATDSDTRQAWLEVDLGAPRLLGRAFLAEAYGQRVRRFTLEARIGEEWRPCHQGTLIGEELRVAFPPVTARNFRLVIAEAADGPTLWEFRLFPPE